VDAKGRTHPGGRRPLRVAAESEQHVQHRRVAVGRGRVDRREAVPAHCLQMHRVRHQGQGRVSVLRITGKRGAAAGADLSPLGCTMVSVKQRWNGIPSYWASLSRHMAASDKTDHERDQSSHPFHWPDTSAESCTAQCHACLQPSGGRLLGGVRAFTSAPLCSSSRTTSSSPMAAAQCSGVAPYSTSRVATCVASNSDDQHREGQAQSLGVLLISLPS